jgi:hypothetical protein
VRLFDWCRDLLRRSVPTHADFFSLFAYAQEGLRTAQRATQQGLEVTQQGLRVAEEAIEQIQEVLRQTDEATREAELRTAVFGVLQTGDYDGLSVAEVSRRLEGPSADELKKVRKVGKHNKNRETLIDQIDRMDRDEGGGREPPPFAYSSGAKARNTSGKVSTNPMPTRTSVSVHAILQLTSLLLHAPCSAPHARSHTTTANVVLPLKGPTGA